MNREEPVSIDAPNGRLFGIVHRPARARSPPACVIMLNSGQLSRVGPQRLYVNAARNWARHGLMVLRLDLAGVGDSEPGDIGMHFDGLLPEDVGAAVEYAVRELQAKSVFLQGLCAGARVAIKHAATDNRIAGVLAWSCPILSSAAGVPPSPFEKPKQVSDWEAREAVAQPIKALLRLKFLRLPWWRNRLHHGLYELSQLLRSVRHLVMREKPGSNPFLTAADMLLHGGRRILFIYGASDRMPLGEFRDRFADVVESSAATQGYCVVPHGTHTFNAVDSQAAVIDLSLRWIGRWVPGVAESEGFEPSKGF